MERSRRQPVVSSSKQSAKGALEALKAAREGGGKRVAGYELKQEEAVYNVVEEEEYAQIVAKRREEGGDFVVDDDGQGYLDIGEEDDYWNAKGDRDNEEEAQEEEEAPGKKRKGPAPKSKDGPKSKKKAADAAAGAAAGSGNIAKLFKNATAKSAVAGMSSRPTKVNNETSDALLDDILGDLGGPSAPVARATPVARTQQTRPVGMSSRPAAAPRAPVRRPVLMPQPAVKHEEVKAEEEGDDHIDHTAEMDLDDGPAAENDTAEEEAGGSATAADVKAEAEDLVPVGVAVMKQEKTSPTAALKPEEVLAPIGPSGWDMMYSSEGGYTAEDGAADVTQKSEDVKVHEGSDNLPLDKNRDLPFFMLDAHENIERPGEVFLFGKIQSENKTWQSCCAVLRNLQRSLVVVPESHVFQDTDGEIAALEAEVAADPSRKMELIKMLHERCSSVKAELREVLSRAGVRQYKMVPVKRSYAFDNPDVPHGSQWCIKIRYPANEPQLALGTKGKTFVAVFGCNQSPLEALLLKRMIKGPSWLLLKSPTKVEYANQISWCKLEVLLESTKALTSAAASGDSAAMSRPSPPLVVASISLKTVTNPSNHQHEVVAASVVHLASVDVEAPTSKEKWDRANVLRNFSIVRRLDGQSWPTGFESAATEANQTPVGKRNGGNMITLQASERSLLTCLLARLQNLDADVYVGHNVGDFDITVLLHRMQHHKVPLWSRIGRLKRSSYPKFTGGGHTFGGGAGAGVLSTLAGRLLCDTYLAARENVKEIDYTLRTLSSTLLKEQRQELSPPDVPRRYENTAGLLDLLRHTECDAWLSLGLMFNLSVLPLTKQLSNLSGFLWARTLQGQRAQRIEMLLLHEFHDRKFILPDKMSGKDKDRLAAMRAHDEDDMEVDGDGGGGPKDKSVAKGKGPQYAGGLVLEPKKGLYDKIVILLDFNSLYPSIIQEFNICFTTVERGATGIPSLPDAPASGVMAPLPTVIQGLVRKRKEVKSAMAYEKDQVKKKQLDIKQTAIKLTANSMYGCLGFANSRFYAKPLAELVTSQGRSILQSTVDLVEGTIGFNVIYGDTDSIMVNTASDDINVAKDLARRIKHEVNRRYKLLEIELDGTYKCMLLLKKKKYAAMKMEHGTLVKEVKGLDIVRRDWCPLSKEVGNYALDQVLSGRPKEDVVMDIHTYLREVKERIHAGGIPNNKFVITKQLTKKPEEYPDAKNQPHVQVALRRRAAGKRDGVQAGETVPYIICIPKTQPAAEGADATPAKLVHHAGGLAERAYHPEELRDASNTLQVDLEYYLGQQVHPVVSRLCAPIEGTDSAQIADCLGLDPQRFRGPAGGGGHSADSLEEELINAGGSMLDDEDNFRDCAPLMLCAPNGTSFPFSGVDALLKGSVSADCILTPPDAVGDESQRLSEAQLVNQVLLRTREAVSSYYDGWMDADDELSKCETRNVTLRPTNAEDSDEVAIGLANRCSHPDATKTGAHMARRMSEKRLYLQLCYFHRLLNVDGSLKRVVSQLRAADPKNASSVTELSLATRTEGVRKQLTAAANAVASVRNSSHYHWVKLGSLFSVLAES